MNFENGIHKISQSPVCIPVWNQSSVFTGSALSAANLAVLLPFWVPAKVTTSKVYVQVDTQSGNIDLGIYDGNGNKVASLGSTACPSAGVASFNLSSTLDPKNGMYFFAFSANNNTVVMNSIFGQPLFRPLAYASSFPLPVSVNLASPTNRTEISFPKFLLELSGGIVLI